MAEVPLSIVPVGLTGRKVLAALVGVFAVVFAVNGTFAYFAISTWPGYAQNDAYERGLHYNDVLDEARRQKELGWTSGVSIEENGLVRVRLIDMNSAPVKLSMLSVSLSRPLGDSKEISVLLGADPKGGFIGRTDPLAAGMWNAIVRAEDGAGHKYRMQHDVEVRP